LTVAGSKMLAYNLSPSFNWDAAGMNDEEIRTFVVRADFREREIICLLGSVSTWEDGFRLAVHHPGRIPYRSCVLTRKR
jgi:hypothetical protein